MYIITLNMADVTADIKDRIIPIRPERFCPYEAA